MSIKKKSTLGKEDLRRLMKAQRNVSNIKNKKIKAVHARYNSLDQLSCSLCNVSIKSDLLWNAHISGRTHRQNIESKNPPPQTSNIASLNTLHAGKRKNDNQLEHESALKQMCTHSIPEETTTEKTKDSGAGDLPSDFFDNGTSSSTEKPDVPKKVLELPSSNSCTPQLVATKAKDIPSVEVDTKLCEKIPEGFFDDPVKDAKAREIEYRDKLDDEWDMFQKVMQEQSTVSEIIMEDEDDFKTTERNIEEIDQQMLHWSKVESLHQTRDQFTHSRVNIKEENIKKEEDSEDEDQEMDEFLDWRSKKAWK